MNVLESEDRLGLADSLGSHVIWKYRRVPSNGKILEVHGKNLNILANSDS